VHTATERLRLVDETRDDAVRAPTGEVDAPPQAGRVLRPRRRGRLDLDAVELLVALDHEVDFVTRSRPPMRQLDRFPAVRRRFAPFADDRALEHVAEARPLPQRLFVVQTEQEGEQTRVDEMDLRALRSRVVGEGSPCR
jgi:hypothetical protein